MTGIIILFGLFFIIFLAASSKKKTEKKEILSPEEKGWKGEEKVLNAIRKFFERKSPADYLLVNGLILQKGNWSCEIDILLLTRKWIYVIEVKNWFRGRLSGNLNHEYLEQSYKVGKRRKYGKIRHYSPFWQNEQHIKRFKNYFQLQNNQNILSIVVFPSPYLEISLKENKKTVFKNKHLWASNSKREDDIVYLIDNYEEKDTQLPFFEKLKEKIDKEIYSPKKWEHKSWVKYVKEKRKKSS